MILYALRADKSAQDPERCVVQVVVLSPQLDVLHAFPVLVDEAEGDFGLAVRGDNELLVTDHAGDRIHVLAGPAA